MCFKFHLQRLAQETFDRLLIWLREMKSLPLTTEVSKPPNPPSLLYLSLLYSLCQRVCTLSFQGKKWRITTFANTLALTSLLFWASFRWYRPILMQRRAKCFSISDPLLTAVSLIFLPLFLFKRAKTIIVDTEVHHLESTLWLAIIPIAWNIILRTPTTGSEQFFALSLLS